MPLLTILNVSSIKDTPAVGIHAVPCICTVSLQRLTESVFGIGRFRCYRYVSDNDKTSYHILSRYDMPGQHLKIMD